MQIAIFLPNWIGDAVMAVPALRALYEKYGHGRITGIGRPYVADVYSGSPFLHDFAACDPQGPPSQHWPALASRLRRLRPELAVLFPNSFRTAWIAWLAGCRRRIGYARYGRSFLLTDRLQPVRDARGRIKPSSTLLAYNRLAEAAGCTDASTRMELFTTPQDELAAARIWRDTGLDQRNTVIALNPGAAFGSAKLWPVEHFATLADRLAQRSGYGVLILCGPNERELARRIGELSSSARVHTLADADVSIGLTKACIRRSHLVVSTDSGPRHIAAAFNRPVVALFGPTHIAWTDTFYPQEIQLQKKVACGPCQLRTCPLDHRCMTELTPDEVLSAVDELLNRVSLPLFVGGRRAG